MGYVAVDREEIRKLRVNGWYSSFYKFDIDTIGAKIFGNMYKKVAGYHPYFGFSFHSPHSNRERDAHGFTNKLKLPFKKTDNMFIVAFLGGSVSKLQARYIRRHQRADFEQLIRKKYNLAQDKEIRFLNLALGGLKQPQAFLIYSYFVDLIDVSINIEGYNEITSSSYPRFPIAFPKGSEGFIKSSGTHPLFLKLGIYRQLLYFFDSQINKVPKSYFLVSTWFYTTRLIRKEIEIVINKIRETSRHPSQETAYISKMVTDKNTEKINVLKKFSSRQAILAKSLKKSTFFILQPNQILSDSKPFSKEEIEGFIEPYEEKARAYRMLGKAYEELNSQHGNFYDFRYIYKETTETVYKDKCCHLNLLGNEIFYKALRKVLRE